MPFKETCPMEERIALLRDYETGVFTVSDLCRRYAISRETFYVWKRRRESGEDCWFEERSHAVASCRHATLAVSPIASSRYGDDLRISVRRRSRPGWSARRRRWRGRQPRRSVTSSSGRGS
jgi:Helix-turn-helix domain